MPSVFPEGTYGHMIVNTPGIVHFMRMNDSSGSGDDADSLSGTSVNVQHLQTGALVGDTSKSVRFTGSNSYITYNNNVKLEGAFSVELWIYPSVNYTSGFPTFFSKENWNSPYSGWSFYIEGRGAPGGMRAAFSRHAFNGVHRVYGLNNLPLNTWTQLVVTYDGATLRMYQNGALTWDTPSSGTMNTSAYPAIVGAASNINATYFSDWFTGNIDELAIYNTALSANTILEHYNRGITSPVTNLYLDKSETIYLGSTDSVAFANTLDATETVTLRSDESVAFENTLGVAESAQIGVTESGSVETAFGGTMLSGYELAYIGSTETTAITTFINGWEDVYLYSAEEQNLSSTMSVAESPVIVGTNTEQLFNLSDINKEHVPTIKRRQGFIHYAVQRLYNGNITVEFPHEPFAPIAYTMPGALDEFELDESMLSDLTQQPNALSLTPFLVRTEAGLPLLLGKCLTSWFDGLIVVTIYDDMTEHPNELKLFGIFPEVTG